MARDIEIIIGAKDEVSEAANRASASLRSMGNTANEAGGVSSGAAAKSELAWLKKGVGVGVAIMALRKMIDYAELAGGASAELSEQMEAFNKVTEDIKVNIGAFVIGAGAALIATFSLIGAAINGVIGAVAKFISYILPFTEFSDTLKSLKDGLEGVAANSFDAASAGLKYAETMDKTAKSAFGLIGSLEGETEAMKKAREEKEKRITAAEKEADRIADAERKRQSDIQDTIIKTAIATARLGASKEELINLQLVEAKAWTWSIRQIESYRAALVGAVEKEEQLAAAKNYIKAEEEIFKVWTATEKMGASKERLNELLAIEAYRQGATSEQVERYLEVLGLAQIKEEEITAEKEARKLAEEAAKVREEADPMGLIAAQRSLDEFLLYQDVATERMNANNILASTGIIALGGVVQSVYGAMTGELLRFIEVGKFSIGAMAKIIAEQVKMELLGYAAKALIGALYYAAVGLGYLATGNPMAGAAFASSAQYALTAAVATASAKGVSSLFGGSSKSSGAATGSSYGGSAASGPLSGGFVPEREEIPQTQNITLQIYNPLSTQNWAEITENNILPALKAASDRNIVMNVQTVYA